MEKEIEYDYDESIMDDFSGLDNVPQKYVIDRDAEDKMVEEYNLTKNPLLLEKIINDRMATIEFWAIKWNKHLSGFETKADLVSGIKFWVIKKIGGYKREKGHFNTFIYTMINNYIKNQYTYSSSGKLKGSTYGMYLAPKELELMQDDVESDMTQDKIMVDDDTLDKAVNIVKKYMRDMSVEDIRTAIKESILGNTTKQIYRVRNSIRHNKGIHRECHKKILELI